MNCCSYRDHSPGPCACTEHVPSPLHPYGEQVSRDGCDGCDVPDEVASES